MSDDGFAQVPAVFSSKERAALVAKALSEAARRARFSTKKRRSGASSGFRARRGERVYRLVLIWSFAAVVLVPSAVAAIYFLFIASDQYAAEARFTLRGGLPPAMDAMGALTGAPPILIIQDTQIILNYMTSRAVVESLNKSVGLERLYQSPDIDVLSRLKDKPSIEKALTYWKKHIDLSVQMPSGIVTFTVKAFTAEDSVKIADAALDASEQLVNRMNDSMRVDALALAQTERERAQANLAKARSDLEKARNDEGILSADLASSALTGLITQVKGQMIKLQEEYDSQRQYVTKDAPQLRNLVTKIDAAKSEIVSLQRQMTDSGPNADGKDDGTEKVLAGSMSRLDYAKLNNTIAEGIYAGALVAVERAQLASEMKLMYINAFIRPVAADRPRYPMRALDSGLVLAATLAIWGALVGVLTLVKGSLG